MEEHPPKRRKVERGSDHVARDHGLYESRERAGSFGDRREKLAIPKLVLPAHHAFGVHGASRQKVQHSHEPQKSSQPMPTKIHPRQLLGTQVSSVVQPAPETASTVLAIAVDNGQGVVSELEVPMTSKSVYIQGYGELTMANDGVTPTITAASGNNPSNLVSSPGAVTPPPAVAASQARDEALATQQAVAKQLNVVPQAPSPAPQESATAGPAPSQTAPAPSSTVTPQQTGASQSPLALNTPGSRSQQVLSSPSTPVPETPQSSAGSSSSYFSSSPVSTTNSSPSRTQNPAISQTLSPNNSQLPATSNYTLSATSSSSLSSALSSSFGSLSSETSATATSLSTPSTVLQASSSSAQSLASLASATRSSSGFATSTLSSQTLSPASSSAQITSAPTTLSSSSSASVSPAVSTTASASSQSLSQSVSASSLSGSSSSTNIGAGGAGGTSSTATSPSPTSSSGSGSSGSNTPPASVLAGGIVGGVAGATILLLILVLLFRWRWGKMGQRRAISPPVPQTVGAGGMPQAGNMTQRSSTAPIAAAGFLGRLRPSSAQTATTTDTAPSERGFQKISGRKLPSVLASGGDGYGDTTTAGPSTAGSGTAAGAAVGTAAAASAGPSSEPAASKAKGVTPGQGSSAGLAPVLRPASPPHSLSGSSFYRDSHGFYGGVVPESTTQAETDTSSSPSTSPSYPAPLNVVGRSPQDRGGPSNRQPEVAITRPGPARTPVINQPGVVPIRTPSRANQPPPRPSRATPPPPYPLRDGLGRSHPSQDGSRGSRFREDTTPP